jgi:hypothetical protein
MKKGSKHSKETLAKMSVAHKGHQDTQEIRAKKSKATTIAMNRPEVKAKISGSNCHLWGGGRSRDKDGYIQVYSPTHPYKDHRGYVYEHRLIMEACLGRVLEPTEVVHHINGIEDDNRIENLMRFDSHSEHMKWHQKMWAKRSI